MRNVEQCIYKYVYMFTDIYMLLYYVRCRIVVDCDNNEQWASVSHTYNINTIRDI